MSSSGKNCVLIIQSEIDRFCKANTRKTDIIICITDEESASGMSPMSTLIWAVEEGADVTIDVIFYKEYYLDLLKARWEVIRTVV